MASEVRIVAQESLSHKEEKGSTAKWFVIGIIPILNLYWLWKAAEVVSGHKKYISKKYEALKHMDKKESTGKWFAIFLLPILLGLLPALSAAIYYILIGGGPGLALGIVAALIALGIIAIIVGLYVLYKMAVSVSGHETWYPEKYETVKHKEKRDSTAKWFVIGIIPILNLYFLWKMGETISGHETVYK